jgi:hypothetical protein
LKSPLPACGERSDGIEDDIRVRGTLRESECVESSPHPRPSLRSGLDLSPQAGRGKKSATHLNGLPAPTMRGMDAPLNHIAIAVVIVGVVVGVGIAIIAIVIPVEAIA